VTKVTCPNHDHANMLFELVDGKIQVKCKKCKRIINIDISVTPPVMYNVPEFVKDMKIKRF
jgi:hypothetical protein